jgi:hypothetical protein
LDAIYVRSSSASHAKWRAFETHFSPKCVVTAGSASYFSWPFQDASSGVLGRIRLSKVVQKGGDDVGSRQVRVRVIAVRIFSFLLVF